MKIISRIISSTAVFIFTATVCFSQKQFFKSAQIFSALQLENFYSSVIVDNELLLFTATDYKLYAYNKFTGEQKWVSTINYKTKVQCFVKDNVIYSSYSENRNTFTAKLSRETGKLIKQLPVGPLLTTPVIRNNILFGTAIIDGGRLFAYDIQGDSLLWATFLAHGVSTQPYFFSNYIQANAEGNNWFRINYNGQLLDTTCKEKADIFVADIPCIKRFGALTHDGYELDVKFSVHNFDHDEDAIAPEKIITSKENSFILHDDKLIVVGNKRKVVKRVDLTLLVADSLVEKDWGLTQLLNANEKTVTLVYKDQLIVFNYRQEKVERTFDLSLWQPYQVLFDENKIWLISRNDGLLYGFAI